MYRSKNKICYKTLRNIIVTGTHIETTIEFKLDFGDYIFFTGILSFTQLLNSNVSNHHFYSKQARKEPTENI